MKLQTKQCPVCHWEMSKLHIKRHLVARHGWRYYDGNNPEPPHTEQTNQEWLDSCRHAARILLKTKPLVSIEDILRVCPRPQHIKHQLTGSVFKHQDFEPVGIVHCTRPGRHRSIVRTWRFSDAMADYEQYWEDVA